MGLSVSTPAFLLKTVFTKVPQAYPGKWDTIALILTKKKNSCGDRGSRERWIWYPAQNQKESLFRSFFGCLVHSPGNSQRLSFFSFTVGVYAASSTATLNGYGVVSTGSITITSSTQKLNFIAANHRDADVRMWVRNDTTGGYLYGPVTLWSEGSTHGPRSTPYTNLKNGKYRLYLECISSAPCYATGKLYHQ